MPNDTLLGRPERAKPYPIQVSFFGLEAIVQTSNTLPNLIQQALGNLQWRCGDFALPVYKISI
jgi:hypothetical protein